MICINSVFRLRPATLLKKRFCDRWFPVNFAKFLRALFLQNTSGRLLLQLHLLKVVRISLETKSEMFDRVLATLMNNWYFRSNHRMCSKKKCFRKFYKVHRKTPVPESPFWKETLAQVFSSKFCEIVKKTLLIKHLQATDSGIFTGKSFN